MGLLQRFKQKRAQKQELDTYLETQERLRERFRHSYAIGIARWCFTCKWFILREEKPRNRVCRCPPEQLHFKSVHGNADECLGWELDPNYVTSHKKE